MILLTGGSGLLGTELRKHLQVYAPPRAELNVLKPWLPMGTEFIVHSAGYTNVQLAEMDPRECYRINVDGTRNIVALGMPVVYISTEYVFDGEKGNYSEDDAVNPVNAYSATKVLGEILVRKTRHLIIRCLFKPRPFKHPRAVTDQFTSGDYVDVMAPLIAQAVRLFHQDKLSGTIHIGTGRKSTYDLARRSREVEAITRADVPVTLPMDTSLDLTKWNLLTSPDHISETRKD